MSSVRLFLSLVLIVPSCLSSLSFFPVLVLHSTSAFEFSYQQERSIVSLDNAPWFLELDGNNPQTLTAKEQGGKVAGPVRVPGSWQQSGFGAETPVMYNQYVGAANYTVQHEIELPIDVNSFLLVERAERSVRVICGGREIGFLRGFLETLEVNVQPCLEEAVGSGAPGRGGYPVGGDPIVPLVDAKAGKRARVKVQLFFKISKQKGFKTRTPELKLF